MTDLTMVDLDNNLMKGDEFQKFTGRRVLKTSENEITEKNIVRVLDKVKVDFMFNVSQIKYLYNYKNGDQPIIHRLKLAYPELKNIVIENHAKELVDFKTGYIFADPIQYVRRAAVTTEKGSEDDSRDITLNIAHLNEYMYSESKHSVDRELGEWMFTCGTSYRYILPDTSDPLFNDGDQSPFELGALDPRRTFVIYHSGISARPVLGGYVVRRGNTDIICCYTRNSYFEVEGDKVTVNKPHFMKDIPIIEYPANYSRMGEFEAVITMLDALNEVTSNRVDAVAQFVQSYLVFKNCDLTSDEFEKMRKKGAIMLNSTDDQREPDAKSLQLEMNQTLAQTLADDLYQKILIICGMPDRDGGSRSTGDTQQAVVLRDGWTAAESRAMMTENIFKESEKRFLKIALRLLERSKKVKVRLSDIDIRFTRNRTDNLITKTQGMLNQLNAGIHPAIVIKGANLYSDPEQTYLDSEPYLKKWEYKRPIQPSGAVADKGERTSQTQNSGENPSNASSAEKP